MLNSRVRNFWVFVLMIYLSTAGSSFALAIPPSQFIVKTWAGKHSGVKSVKLKSLVSAIEDEKPTGVHFKETTLYIPELQLIRSWATDDSDRKLYMMEKSVASLSPVSKTLLSSHFRDIMASLKDRGVPIQTDEDLLPLKTEDERVKAEVESLERLNGKPYWVIGNTAIKDGPSPQVWFEKDTFLPKTMIYSSTGLSNGGKLGDVQEFRFENFRYFKDFPYPFIINVIEKGNRVLSSQLLDCAINSDYSNFKKSRSGASETGFTEAGKSASSSVRDLIRLYYDVVR